ncbi:hypothetical protein LWI28_014062 [Acer negundo]|uniref:Uncharacterized protein n=1 Tax=Acer negundo TaxID=4023 RepID=A0AAD5IF31_ACENE|nr:hypothetical protein LWI28_014062 [Acer negundo]
MDDQIAVPEDIKNLEQGFFFTVQFYYITKLVYPNRILAIEDDRNLINFTQKMNIHCQFFLTVEIFRSRVYEILKQLVSSLKFPLAHLVVDDDDNDEDSDK